MKTVFFTLLSLFSLHCTVAQMQFVDIITGIDNSFKTGLVATPDSGWITLYLQAQPTGAIRHDLVIDRYDACGIHIDSKSFHFNEEIQIAIQQVYPDPLNNTYWVLLHSYGASDKAILCQFNMDAEILKSTLLSVPGDDFFVYSIARNATNQMTVYGNANGGSTITVLNEDLSIQSLNGLHRTFIWGTFLPTEDGGYLCRSGSEVWKVNQSFEVIWARRSPGHPGSFFPIEVTDGYIFSYFPYSSMNRENFLIKLNKSTGEVMWVSPDVGGSGFTHIRQLRNGNIVQIGEVHPEESTLKHIHLSIFNPETGAVVDQFAYSPDTERNFIGDQLIELPNGQMVLTGYGRFFSHGVEMMINADFTSSCGAVNYNRQNDPPNIQFTDFTPALHNYNLVSQSVQMIERSSMLFSERICEVNEIDLSTLDAVDTVLCAGGSISVDYTDVPYTLKWSDGGLDRIRTIQAPADLQVIFSDCEAEESIPIRLDTIDCTCDLYVPTAFSPNDDGINDVLNCYSSCSLLDYRLEIYDRFGSRVFESLDSNIGWDGNARKGKQMTPGVYAVVIHYTVSENNMSVEKLVKQDVSLLR